MDDRVPDDFELFRQYVSRVGERSVVITGAGLVTERSAVAVRPAGGVARGGGVVDHVLVKATGVGRRRRLQQSVIHGTAGPGRAVR